MQDQDYIARHSLKDRITFLVMTLTSGFLLTLFLTQPGQWLVKCLLFGICCFSAFWAYVFFVSSVRFSSDLIQVKVQPFVDYSRTYGDIEALKEQKGSLKVQFAGGKSLSLPAGLGDSKKIASIFEKKTDITPEFLRWGR
jgi:hypothetical protein